MKGRWVGLEPIYCAIHALVDDDEVKNLYLDWCSIDRNRHAIYGHNSTNKRATTVWEMIANSWNNPTFNPVTEIVFDLHLKFIDKIELDHENIAHFHLTTPEFAESQL